MDCHVGLSFLAMLENISPFPSSNQPKLQPVISAILAKVRRLGLVFPVIQRLTVGGCVFASSANRVWLQFNS